MIGEEGHERFIIAVKCRCIALAQDAESASAIANSHCFAHRWSQRPFQRDHYRQRDQSPPRPGGWSPSVARATPSACAVWFRHIGQKGGRDVWYFGHTSLAGFPTILPPICQKVGSLERHRRIVRWRGHCKRETARLTCQPTTRRQRRPSNASVTLSN
jgi:hypothetical protein